MLSEWRDNLPEIILLLACWVPFLRRPIPPQYSAKTDVGWAAEFIHQVVSGGSLWALPDPYFRYIPQIVVLEVVSYFQPVSVITAIRVNAHYTMLMEGLVAPGLVYLLVSRSAGRRGALFAAGVLAMIMHLPVNPQLPKWLFTWPVGGNYWNWQGRRIWGLTYYYTSLWHYAPAIPFALASFLAVQEISPRRWVLLSIGGGVSLGLVGSIQVVQGVFAAMIVSATLIWRREVRAWVLLGVVAAIVATPNLFVLLDKSGRWTKLGSSRVSLEVANFVQLAVVVTILGLMAYAAWQFLQRTQADDWISTLPVTKTQIVLVVLPLVLMVLFIPLSGGWYRLLAASYFRYGFVAFAGIALTSYFS